ncbi:glucose-6-phosphate exchanger SLC37A2-like, partial [Paramuricea clavata]
MVTLTKQPFTKFDARIAFISTNASGSKITVNGRLFIVEKDCECVPTTCQKEQRVEFMGLLTNYNTQTSTGQVIEKIVEEIQSGQWSRFMISYARNQESEIFPLMSNVVDPNYHKCQDNTESPQYCLHINVDCIIQIPQNITGKMPLGQKMLCTTPSAVILSLHEVFSRTCARQNMAEIVFSWGGVFVEGVLEYSLCLFFAKLVSYTFLYWLPYYIAHTDIGGVRYDSHKAGDLSIFFDVGGIIGGILAGVISDQSHCSGITCVVMLVFASPSLYLYRFCGNKDLGTNI